MQAWIEQLNTFFWLLSLVLKMSDQSITYTECFFNRGIRTESSLNSLKLFRGAQANKFTLDWR